MGCAKQLCNRFTIRLIGFSVKRGPKERLYSWGSLVVQFPARRTTTSSSSSSAFSSVAAAAASYCGATAKLSK